MLEEGIEEIRCFIGQLLKRLGRWIEVDYSLPEEGRAERREKLYAGCDQAFQDGREVVELWDAKALINPARACDVINRLKNCQIWLRAEIGPREE